MKRALETSLLLLLIGATPALAADGIRHGASRDSERQLHDFHRKRAFDHRRELEFPWFAHWHDPLRSWDDGFFADLKYRRERFGYWPLHRGGSHSSGAVEVVNGEAVYIYDRSYPYDHYDHERYGSYGADLQSHDQSANRCRVQQVWSDRDRQQVPVRICS